MFGWKFDHPWVYLLIFPLGILLYFLFQIQKNPQRTPWGFLLDPHQGHNDQQVLGRQVHWPLFLISLITLLSIATSISQPYKEVPFKIYLHDHHPFLSSSLSQTSWSQQITKFAHEHGFKTLHFFIHKNENSWLEFKTAINQFDELSLDAFQPCPKPRISQFHLVSGFDRNQFPQLNFIPYPNYNDSRYLSKLEQIGKDQYRLEVHRKPNDLSQTCKLILNGKVIAENHNLAQEQNTVFFQAQSPFRLSLQPLDGFPSNDQINKDTSSVYPIEIHSEFKIPDLIQASKKIHLKEPNTILITTSYSSFSNHQGPALCFGIHEEDPGIFSLKGVPPESSYRLITWSSLAYPSRHALFDLRLKQLPKHHIICKDAELLASQGHEPVVILLSPGKCITTLNPSDINFRNSEEAETFYTLLLEAVCPSLATQSQTLFLHQQSESKNPRLSQEIKAHHRPAAIHPLSLMIALAAMGFMIKVLKN